MKKIESHIFGIFPTPIYTTKLKRKLNKEENKFIKNTLQDCYRNHNNLTSNNNYVLDNQVFKELKIELTEIVKDYFIKVVDSSNNLKPYITQSWLNFTKENEYHHKHSHPNSVVSGVLYIEANKNNDHIVFYDDSYQQIRPKVKNYNLYNCDAWYVPAESYKIILFPSSLTHSVEIKKGKNNRTSLAFNTFIKGTLGDKQDLTNVVIK